MPNSVQMFTRRIMRATGLACVLGLAAAILAIAVVESVRVASGATRVAGATVSQVLDDDDWMRDVRAGRFFKKSSPIPSSHTRNYQDEVSPYDRGSRSNLGRPPTLDELRPRRSTKPRVIRSSTTYRTLCVRECDGAFFPISTSTTRDRFSEDEATCKSQCGVPARLYVHKTIGGSIETMVDVKGRPYDKQPNAFLFRTKYVAACTCRAHPWEKAARERHAGYSTRQWQRKAKKVARLNRRKARKQRH